MAAWLPSRSHSPLPLLLSQAAWACIVSAVLSLPLVLTGQDVGFLSPQRGSTEPLLSSPLLPRSLTAERHVHDHDPALAVNVRTRNVLRLLVFPPASMAGLDQLCVAFEQPPPLAPRVGADGGSRGAPLQRPAPRSPSVDNVLDAEGVEAMAGHAHFMLLQRALTSEAARSPAALDQRSRGARVAWTRPAGGDALVSVLPLDFLPSPYSAWSVTVEAQSCSSSSSSSGGAPPAKPRRANWLPGDGDPEGRLHKDAPLFFPAVRYDSGMLAAELAEQEAQERRDWAAAGGDNALRGEPRSSLADCVGCESMFLRPSLATRLNALPHLSGGVVPRRAEFALSTSALPPKLLQQQQSATVGGPTAGDDARALGREILAASRSYRPTLVVLADPRCDYTVTLSSDESTVLGQWLHHHSPWAIAGLVATTLFILSAMLNEWEGRSRAAVAAVAAARRASIVGGGARAGRGGVAASRKRSASTRLPDATASPPPRVVDLFSFDAPPRLPHFPSLHHAIARSWRWLLAVSAVHVLVIPLLAPSWSPIDTLHDRAAAYAETATVDVPVLSSGAWWPLPPSPVASLQRELSGGGGTDELPQSPPLHAPRVMAVGTPLGWIAPSPADVATAFVLAIACACAVSLLANAAIVACRCANRCRVVGAVSLRRWRGVKAGRGGGEASARALGTGGSWGAGSSSPRQSPSALSRSRPGSLQRHAAHHASASLVPDSARSAGGDAAFSFEDRLLGRGMPGWDAAEAEGTQSLRLVGASIDWDNVPSTPTGTAGPSQAFLRRKASAAVLNELVTTGAGMGSDAPSREGGSGGSAGGALPLRSHSSGLVGFSVTDMPSPRVGGSGGSAGLTPLQHLQRRQGGLGGLAAASFYTIVGDDPRLRAAAAAASKRKTSAINEEDILQDLVDCAADMLAPRPPPRYGHRHTASEGSSGPASARRGPPPTGSVAAIASLSALSVGDCGSPRVGLQLQPNEDRPAALPRSLEQPGRGVEAGEGVPPLASAAAFDDSAAAPAGPPSALSIMVPCEKSNVVPDHRQAGDPYYRELASPSPTGTCAPQSTPLSMLGGLGSHPGPAAPPTHTSLTISATIVEDACEASSVIADDCDSHVGGGAQSSTDDDGAAPVRARGGGTGATAPATQQRQLGLSAGSSVALVWWVATGDWVPGPPPTPPPAAKGPLAGEGTGRSVLESTPSAESLGRASSNDSGIELTLLVRGGAAVVGAADVTGASGDTDESTDEVPSSKADGGAQTLQRATPLQRAASLHRFDAEGWQGDDAGLSPPSVASAAAGVEYADRGSSADSEAARSSGGAQQPSSGLGRGVDALLRLACCCCLCCCLGGGGTGATRSRVPKNRRAPLLQAAVSLTRMLTSAARQAGRVVVAMAAPLVAASAAKFGTACRAAASAAPSVGQLQPALRWAVFLGAASFAPWLVLLGCYAVLLAQTLLSAASYHAARVRRRMFESQQLLGDGGAARGLLACFGSAFEGSGAPGEKVLATTGDAKGGGGDSASSARDSGGRSSGGGRSSSDMRYYAHVVAVVNLLRYQQILLLLYAAILGMQASVGGGGGERRA